MVIESINQALRQAVPDSFFRPVFWRSSFSKRSAKSTGAAKIIAAELEADEVRVTFATHESLFGAHLTDFLLFNSTCILESISTWHEPKERHISADDVPYLQYFESKLESDVT